MSLDFDILAVKSDEIYERRGRVQRIVGIRSQWFHHHDAIFVPEDIFSNFSTAFRNSHPAFNYYGATEYKGQELVRLCEELRARLWFDGRTEASIQRQVDDAVLEILAEGEGVSGWTVVAGRMASTEA